MKSNIKKNYLIMNTGKRKNIMRMLLLLEVVYVLLFDGFFQSITYFSWIHYTLDFANLILLCGLSLDIKSISKIKKDLWVFIPWLLYGIICVLSAVINKVNILLFLWALRNTFRFLIFFVSCIVYIDKEDMMKFLKMIVNLQFVNFPVVIIQFVYFKLNRDQIEGIWFDHIGGIFGIETGCTGNLNFYLSLILIIVLVEVFEKKAITWKYTFVVMSAMLCAALSELKFFFFEVVAFFAVFVVLYIKKVNFVLIVKSFLILAFWGSVCFFLMYKVCPTSVKYLADYASYEKACSDVYKISRSHAFSDINNFFFGDSIVYRIFGLGFGNCENGRFSFLTSDFFNQYGAYNYRWFSHQMLYLETGILGFITFACFPVFIALHAFRIFLKDDSHRFIAAFTIGVAAITFICLWYNNIIRTDFAYVNYLCLSALLIFLRSDFKSEKLQFYMEEHNCE